MIKELEKQCEWQSDQFRDESAWTEHFDEADLAELDQALRHALRVSDQILEIKKQDFPLTTLVNKLKTVEAELINGRGFVKLRGIDRDRYSQSEMEVLYWGIGLHLGKPWPQNKHGHVLGDVTDQHVDPNDPTTRGNEIGGVALPFHCDGSDLVGLMCLENGLEGGLSTICNVVRIHNQLVREAPELSAALYEGLPNDYRGEQAEGRNPWYMMPVFTAWQNRLFVRCIPPYIRASQRHAEAPRLSKAAWAGIERLVELSEDPDYHIAMQLQPGDIQFINNYHVMHGRTPYKDGNLPGQKRHLKRLWLETEVLKDRPPHFRASGGGTKHWADKVSASRMKVN